MKPIAVNVPKRVKFPSTIHARLIATAVVPVILIALAAAVTAYTVSVSVSALASLFEKNYFLEDVLQAVSSAENNLSNYISSRNTENLKRYYYYSAMLRDISAGLRSDAYANEGVLIERDIAALLAAFTQTGEEAVQAKRGWNTAEYIRKLGQTRELGSQIRERIASLRLILLDDQLQSVSYFSLGMKRALALNLATIAAALLFGISVILFFTRRISEPISRLGAEAKKIAGGILDDSVIQVEGDDEIASSATAFNMMKKSIRESIDDIHAKAEVERALLNERMKNLEMNGLLRKAELDALQAKINPHFLFNTLNTGLQLAVVEDAEKTRLFLEQLASLMRYSFRETENPATVGEEINYLKSYLYLMTIRFPGVFDIAIDISPEAESALVPKMIVQPLAENALQHGLKEKSAGAMLKVSGKVEVLGAAENSSVEKLNVENSSAEKILVLTIEDNGTGISAERIAEIFAVAGEGRDLQQAEHSAHGHGLSNVIRRLRHFSGREDVMSIAAAESGTRIVITIPYREAS